MSTVLVTGSASGLGKEIAKYLAMYGHAVHHYDIVHGQDVLKPDVSSIETLDVLINCAGINGINMLEDIEDDLWDTVVGVNAKGIYKMSQACLPLLKRSRGTIVNVTSNAAHMPMTSSLCYNASKGAAEIMTKQMARELTRRWGITVFGIAPNKLRDTAMSHKIDAEVVRTRGWTLEEAQKYQIAGLLSGFETDPRHIAELLSFLLATKDRHAYLTGCILQLGL
jgi:3-oxoacyl-[acyl-carrier protein] reductase